MAASGACVDKDKENPVTGQTFVTVRESPLSRVPSVVCPFFTMAGHADLLDLSEVSLTIMQDFKSCGAGRSKRTTERVGWERTANNAPCMAAGCGSGRLKPRR